VRLAAGYGEGVQTRDIEYHHDGKRYVGHLAEPDGEGPVPAVLVCHEGPGLDEHAKGMAIRLADLGFLAFALDYHGDGQPLELSQIREKLGPLRESAELTRAIGGAGLDVLLAQPRVDPERVAAIGFCFGGTMALELAREGRDLQAVVGFHSGLQTTRPDDARNIRGTVLVCIGADDPMIPPEQRADFEQEMRAAGIDWRMNLYGGTVHSFTNPNAGRLNNPAVAYHELSAVRSWRAMLDLFDEVMPR
jgi:dienelactone hydrolase